MPGTLATIVLTLQIELWIFHSEKSFEENSLEEDWLERWKILVIMVFFGAVKNCTEDFGEYRYCRYSRARFLWRNT